MIRLVLPIWLAVISGPVWALSCAPYTPVDAYHDAAEAEARFIVATGKLEFDADQLPRTEGADQPVGARQIDIPARITGRVLSRAGFSQPFDADLTLEVQCLGPWCGSLKPGATYLAFLELRGDAHVLTVAPCTEFAFADPTPPVLHQIEQCFNGAFCRRRKR